jgi:hypothetical protein
MMHPQRGTVLVVILGLLTLILSLTLVLTLAVQRSQSDSRTLVKQVQATLMAQAALVYLNPYWDRQRSSFGRVASSDLGLTATGLRRPVAGQDLVGPSGFPGAFTLGYWFIGFSGGSYYVAGAGGSSQGSSTALAAPFDQVLWLKGTYAAATAGWDFTVVPPGQGVDASWPTDALAPALVLPSP